MAAAPAREGRGMRRSRRYSLSITAGGLAFSVRAVLDPLLLDNAPFVFFLPAVLVACFFLGRGPAALTTGLGLVLGDVYFQPPRGTPTVAYDALAEGLAYLIVAFLIMGFWPAGQRFTAWLERAFLDLDSHRAAGRIGAGEHHKPRSPAGGNPRRRCGRLLTADGRRRRRHARRAEEDPARVYRSQDRRTRWPRRQEQRRRNSGGVR